MGSDARNSLHGQIIGATFLGRVAKVHAGVTQIIAIVEIHGEVGLLSGGRATIIVF